MDDDALRLMNGGCASGGVPGVLLMLSCVPHSVVQLNMSGQGPHTDTQVASYLRQPLASLDGLLQAQRDGLMVHAPNHATTTLRRDTCRRPILSPVSSEKSRDVEPLARCYVQHLAERHAYFTPLAGVADGPTRFAALAEIFRHRLVPLLEEYFFEDWQKIRLVLADNQKPVGARFVVVREDQDGDLAGLFGSEHGLDSYATKKRYALSDEAFTAPAAYVGVYEVDV